MEFSERLTALRKKAGLSQEKLAEQLQISRQAVSKWESGVTSPDMRNIVQLSALYGVSTDYILTGEEAQDTPPAPLAQAARTRRGPAGFLRWGIFVLAGLIVLYFVTNGFH